MYDAARIPFFNAEWVPQANLLILDCQISRNGDQRAFFLHGLPGKRQASQVVSSLGLEDMVLSSGRSEVLSVLMQRGGTLPPPEDVYIPDCIQVLSATWIQSRLSLFLETNIEVRGDRRHLVLAQVPDEDNARSILFNIHLEGLPLQVDSSRSSYDLVTDLHSAGVSTGEIARQTGFPPPIIHATIQAFQARVPR